MAVAVRVLGAEVEAELHPAAARRRPLRGRGSSCHGHGWHGAAAVCLAQQLAGCACLFTGDARQALDERAELVLAKQAQDLLAVVVAESRRLEVESDRQIAPDGHQIAPAEDLVVVLGQLDAQLLGLDGVEVGVDALKRAELLQYGGRRLLADPGDARNVVGGITLERLEVDHLRRLEAISFAHPRGVVVHGLLDAAPGDHQRRVLADQLEHVQVARHDGRLDVLRLGLADQRGDHIVSLIAGELARWDAERTDDLANHRELVAQVIGHLLAGRLVVGILLVAEGRAGQIERSNHEVGLNVLEAAQHDAPEAEHGVHELALAGRQGRVHEREIGPVDEPIRVEEHQPLHCVEFTGARPAGRDVATQRSADQWIAEPSARVGDEQQCRQAECCQHATADHERLAQRC